MSFTVYTNSNTLWSPHFVGVPFAERFRDPPSKLRDYLLSRMHAAHSAGFAFIVLFIIDEESPWIGTYLSEAFKAFPNDVLDSVIPQRRGGYGSTILPHSARSHRVSYDLNCVINHPTLTHESAVSNVKGHLLGVHFTPIGTWICPPSVLQEESRTQNDAESQAFEAQHIIVLFSSSHIVKNKLDTHFNASRFAYRKDRLNDNPWWIFIDLLYLFSDWRDIWEAARSDLVVRDAETHNDIKAPPLLELTRQLHRDTANVIALREHLRLHVSAVQNYHKLVSSRRGAGETHEQLMERTDDLLEDLRNHQETSQVILHQLENLVSLAFNIQNVSHSQVVARLNMLVLVFLPLILVAGIFGTTTWTIRVVWYPLWGGVAVIVVLVVFYIIKWILERSGSSSHPPRLRQQDSSSPKPRYSPLSEKQQTLMAPPTRSAGPGGGYSRQPSDVGIITRPGPTRQSSGPLPPIDSTLDGNLNISFDQYNADGRRRFSSGALPGEPARSSRSAEPGPSSVPRNLVSGRQTQTTDKRPASQVVSPRPEEQISRHSSRQSRAAPPGRAASGRSITEQKPTKHRKSQRSSKSPGSPSKTTIYYLGDSSDAQATSPLMESNPSGIVEPTPTKRFPVSKIFGQRKQQAKGQPGDATHTQLYDETARQGSPLHAIEEEEGQRGEWNVRDETAEDTGQDNWKAQRALGTGSYIAYKPQKEYTIYDETWMSPILTSPEPQPSTYSVLGPGSSAPSSSRPVEALQQHHSWSSSTTAIQRPKFSSLDMSAAEAGAAANQGRQEYSYTTNREAGNVERISPQQAVSVYTQPQPSSQGNKGKTKDTEATSPTSVSSAESPVSIPEKAIEVGYSSIYERPLPPPPSPSPPPFLIQSPGREKVAFRGSATSFGQDGRASQNPEAPLQRKPVPTTHRGPPPPPPTNFARPKPGSTFTVSAPPSTASSGGKETRSPVSPIDTRANPTEES